MNWGTRRFALHAAAVTKCGRRTPPGYTLSPNTMSTPPRETQMSLVAADGSRSPFLATGVRIPFPDGAWVGIDLDRHPRSLSVVVHVRNRRPGAEPTPTIAIVPVAGGAAIVQVGRTGPTAFEVTPVDRAELTGDIHEWLAKTTSGDPLGELVLARAERPTTSARKFVAQYGDLAEVHLNLRESDDALLVLDISVRMTKVVAMGVPSESLGMLVLLQASNVVTFLFREVTVTRME